MEKKCEKTAVWIWLRGGGGHKVVKEAIQQRMAFEFAKQSIELNSEHDYDILGKHFLNSYYIPKVGKLGDFCVWFWNRCQEKGDPKTQKFLASSQFVVDTIFAPMVYNKTRKILMSLEREPDFLISTQNLCNSAFLKAIQYVNRVRNWKMHLRLYITDMPSPQAIHYFNSLKKIGRNEELSKLITLYSPPLLKRKEGEKEFWKKHCGSINIVTNEGLPVRRAFLDTQFLKEQIEAENMDIELTLNREEERESIFSGLSNLSSIDQVQKRKVGQTVKFNIKKDDKVALLMLGTIPNHRAVLEWIDTMVGLAEEKAYAHHLYEDCREQHYYFFVSCGPITNTGLIHDVTTKLKGLKKEGMLPENLSVIPFTNQTDKEIAPLMARSDTTITRSGGSTSMELLHLNLSLDLSSKKNRLTLIHSDGLQKKQKSGYDPIATKAKLIAQILKMKTLDQNTQKVELLLTTEEKEELIVKKIEDLRKIPRYACMARNDIQRIAIRKLLIERGIVLWEAGNVYYLIKQIKAEVVNPEYATESLRSRFFERTRCIIERLEVPEYSYSESLIREALL